MSCPMIPLCSLSYGLRVCMLSHPFLYAPPLYLCLVTALVSFFVDDLLLCLLFMLQIVGIQVFLLT